MQNFRKISENLNVSYGSCSYCSACALHICYLFGGEKFIFRIYPSIVLRSAGLASLDGGFWHVALCRAKFC